MASCPTLVNPEYGRVEVAGVYPDQIATYSCLKGYRLTGSSTRRCLKSGQWTGKSPLCKKVTPSSSSLCEGKTLLYFNSISLDQKIFIAIHKRIAKREKEVFIFRVTLALY